VAVDLYGDIRVPSANNALIFSNFTNSLFSVGASDERSGRA
jgi:hypothetical protein